MPKLAMLGGPKTVPQALRRTEWPIITDADQEAVLRALHSGKLVANADGETEVKALEREWADFVNVRHCAAVASGTAALQLALAALEVGPGDEVIVPALSFNATALAPLHQLATPIFVDVEPDTFNIDPARLEEAVTPRTKAIIPVHLHGLPADMDAILSVATRHRLAVIEDAAQAHGATYQGHQVGSIGTINCFSLHPSKNLPSCGEGGLVTTDDTELHERVAMRRQFGEILQDGQARTYIAYVVGWNHKLNPIQAAFARSQLTRFTEYQRRREANVKRFLRRLGELPGIRPPHCPADRTHAWHILRFRFDPTSLGLADIRPGAFRQALHRALRAEGVPISRYQVMPLPGQAAFRTGLGIMRDHQGALADPTSSDDPLERFPKATAIIEDSLCLQKRHLNPFSSETLECYADGFEKVWENLDVIVRFARSLSNQTPRESVTERWA